MKNVLFIALLILPFITRAQLNLDDPDLAWRGMGELGKPIDTVIKGQNYLIRMSDDKISYSFYSARVQNNGGLLLTYRSYVDTAESLNLYFFNKYGKCYLFQTVQNLENLSPQLATMSSDFIKINDNTLYHKRLDLKMVYRIDLKYNLVIFNYARKKTLIPK